jgi:DNA polymerase III sliding clamp (beta) subunit (PCNA family)
MHLILESDNFRNAMRTAAQLFGAEIDVLLTADDQTGRLYIEAGHQGVYMKASFEANVQAPGSAVVPVQHVTQLKFTEKLELLLDGTQLSFKAGRFKGSLNVGADSSKIESQRPVEEFKAKVALPAEVLKNAVSRANFGAALPGTGQGLRIQAGDELKISTTDQYRASLFKEKLAVPQPNIDVLLKPSFVQTILGRIEDFEICIGAKKGTFLIKTDSLEVYHPVIQTEPDDIEAWIAEGIDYDARKCEVKTQVEALSGAISEATSITASTNSFETHLNVMIKGPKMIIKVTADHGSAQSSLQLDESDAEKHVTKLSARYTFEILNLIKAGDLTVGFWDNFVLMTANSGKFSAIIPTIAA